MNEFTSALRALPKAELHVHLDGSVRPQTLLDLAWAQKLEPIATNVDAVIETLGAGKVFGNLQHYLDAFAYTLAVMQTSPALRRISHELIEDAARENIHHFEVRFCPALHTRSNLNIHQVLDAVTTGLKEGQRKYEVSFGVIVVALRDREASHSIEMAKAAIEWQGRGVVGFDLAGPEFDHPATRHRDAIGLALHHDLGVTLHAGEVTGPQQILEAIELGAQRIGHGVKLRDDDEALQHMLACQLPLEMCPTSNVQTQAVMSYKDHPALDYHRRGLPVVINTDNRLMSNTTVTEELAHLHEHHHLTWNEAQALCKAGFKYAFLPQSTRDDLVQRVDQISEKLQRAGFTPDGGRKIIF